MRRIFIDVADFPHIDARSPVIALVYGDVGYYPIYTERSAAELNGVALSEKIKGAAISGSMFGWDCKGALPAVEWMRGEE